jgi:uncharacterized membrane protein
MNNYIRFLLSLIILDYIWLTLTSSYQRSYYTHLQNSPMKIDYHAMILFYLIAPFAFIYFIKPLASSKRDAFVKGAIMGFLMYMTFDLTNKAVLSRFTWKYAIQDMIWGSFVIGMSSYIAYKK